ncbi:MAG: hypothetical protein II215_06105 [Paludibacteraceae bacterium]|nr:hypothetical protein [Paludibacteraceae bacterium]
MKKIIKLGLMALMATMIVSCNSNSCNNENTCKKECPAMHACPKKCHKMKHSGKDFEKWAKFDSLSEQEQKELIQKAKTCIDNREAKRKAYRDSINNLWENFDNLTIEQQKSLLMKKMHGFDGPRKFHKHHKHMGCKKDFKKPHCKHPKAPCPQADNK